MYTANDFGRNKNLTRLRKLVIYAMLVAFVGVAARATEGGGSVYPTGAETVLPGLTPGAGGTMFAEFNNFYQANLLAGAQGHNLVPGFHLRVGAVAGKLTHNWGVHLLGGTLVSFVAVPVLYEHLDAPFGRGDKTGVGNPEIGVISVAYHKRAWHWWYGVDAYTPGFSYHRTDLLNIGQHNFAVSPDSAFTYLPDKGKMEISSKLQYVVNYANPVTNYRSGNVLIWEYVGMYRVVKNVSAGVNGYLYQQTTDDRQNGLVFDDGNRGRDFAIGPEIRCHVKQYSLILKYQKEMLVQSKTIGNSFWLEMGVPLGHAGRD